MKDIILAKEMNRIYQIIKEINPKEFIFEKLEDL